MNPSRLVSFENIQWFFWAFVGDSYFLISAVVNNNCNEFRMLEFIFTSGDVNIVWSFFWLNFLAIKTLNKEKYGEENEEPEQESF
jgi:hypothetical protein